MPTTKTKPVKKAKKSYEPDPRQERYHQVCAKLKRWRSKHRRAFTMVMQLEDSKERYEKLFRQM
jgi:hypothetical protein